MTGPATDHLAHRPDPTARPASAAGGGTPESAIEADTRARRAAEAPDRLVFFFSGFDPKGAGFYHRMFRDGIGLRNATHGDSLTLGPRHRIGRWASSWTVAWRSPSGPSGMTRAARTRVHFMRWDDLIREHWKRPVLQLLQDYWNVYAKGISTGVFSRIRSKSRAAFWLALFPLGVAAGTLAAGLLLGTVVPLSAGWLHPLPATLLGLALGVAAWRLIARWIDCEWLLRLYAFTRLQALGALPALEGRQSDMAARLVELVDARIHQPGAAPLKEVLVVGYSTGSALAATVVARALPRLRTLLDGRGGAEGTTLAMLTLGHCIPVAADWGGADQVRSELEELSRCDWLVWHDYSAPADWAAFSATPPWPRPARLKGHQASPRFHAQMSAFDYAALRRDRREMHLQYLRAPSQPVDAEGYDFFALTTGPTTLAQRHEALHVHEESRP